MFYMDFVAKSHTFPDLGNQHFVVFSFIPFKEILLLKNTFRSFEVGFCGKAITNNILSANSTFNNLNLRKWSLILIRLMS